MDRKEYEARAKTLAEIEQYARGKAGEKFGQKYAPKAPPPDEEQAEAMPDGDELDQESLARLAAMAGE